MQRDNSEEHVGEGEEARAMQILHQQAQSHAARKLSMDNMNHLRLSMPQMRNQHSGMPGYSSLHDASMYMPIPGEPGQGYRQLPMRPGTPPFNMGAVQGLNTPPVRPYDMNTSGAPGMEGGSSGMMFSPMERGMRYTPLRATGGRPNGYQLAPSPGSPKGRMAREMMGDFMGMPVPSLGYGRQQQRSPSTQQQQNPSTQQQQEQGNPSTPKEKNSSSKDPSAKGEEASNPTKPGPSLKEQPESPRTPAQNETLSSDNFGEIPSAVSDEPKAVREIPARKTPCRSFPSKLHRILSDPAYMDIICWLPHGRAFRVVKPQEFENEVIPKFFRSDKYASFMRQVNGWGFRRILEGPDMNAYYHEMFLRGLPDVAARMKRPCKGKLDPNRNLGDTPDFYKLSMFAPLPDMDGCLSHIPTRIVSNKGTPPKRLDRLSRESSLSSLSQAPLVQGTPPVPASPGSRLSPGRLRDEHFSIPGTPGTPRTPGTPIYGSGLDETGSLSSWAEQQDMLLGPLRSNLLAGSEPLRMEDDHQGLSPADLVYLTQQNRILLQEAQQQLRGEGASSPSPTGSHVGQYAQL